MLVKKLLLECLYEYHMELNQAKTEIEKQEKRYRMAQCSIALEQMNQDGRKLALTDRA